MVVEINFETTLKQINRTVNNNALRCLYDLHYTHCKLHVSMWNRKEKNLNYFKCVFSEDEHRWCML